jgi:hypothetical protein
MSVDYSKIAFSSRFRYEHMATDTSGNPLKSSVAFSVAPSTFPTITIPHNLGYVPFFRLYYGFNDGKYYPLFSGPSSYNIDGNSFQIDNVYADATNIYVYLENDNTVTVSGRIYYRIYAEPQS